MADAARRADYRSRGLCENCGGRSPLRGRTWCLKCLRTKNLTQIDLRHERRERRLCAGCGRRPVPGQTRCDRCKARNRESMRRQRAKAAGGGA